MTRKRATVPSTIRGRGRGRGRSRSPGRGNQAQAPAEPQPYIENEIREFWYRKEKDYFDEHINQNIIQGTDYKFNVLADAGFPLVKQAFAFQGWIDFCRMDEPMDYILIRKWYANLIPSDTHTNFRTLISGNEVRWSTNILRGFLNQHCLSSTLTNEGVKFELNSHDSHLIPNFDRQVGFYDLFEKDFQGKDSKNASHLTPTNRLIFHIIVHCIMPQAGSLTSMSHSSLCILYCLSKHIKIDLPHIIINHMCNIRRNPRCAYAYGMLITKYAHKYYDLPVDAPMIHNVEKFSTGRLSRLFTKLDDGTWTKLSSGSSKRSRTESGSDLNIISISSSSEPTGTVPPSSSAPTWTAPSSQSSWPSSSNAPHIDNHDQQVPPYTGPSYQFTQPMPNYYGIPDPYAQQMPPIDETAYPLTQHGTAYDAPYIPPYGIPGHPPPSSSHDQTQAHAPRPTAYDLHRDIHQETVNSTLIGQLHHLQLINRRIESRLDTGFNQLHLQYNQLHDHTIQSEERIREEMVSQQVRMDHYGQYLNQTFTTMENTQRLMGRQIVTLNERIQRLDDYFSTHFGMPPPPMYNNGNDGFDAASYEHFGVPPPDSNRH